MSSSFWLFLWILAGLFFPALFSSVDFFHIKKQAIFVACFLCQPFFGFSAVFLTSVFCRIIVIFFGNNAFYS